MHAEIEEKGAPLQKKCSDVHRDVGPFLNDTLELLSGGGGGDFAYSQGENLLPMGQGQVAMQFKSASENPAPNLDAGQSIQRKENNTGLPDKLKTGIENLSGYSMDDVKVHYNSSKPSQLQARAYAQGTDIHLGPGQERHLPHEAWHVVQQKQGKVRPTVQMKGRIDVNDDAGLEREADVMGERALIASNNSITASTTNVQANHALAAFSSPIDATEKTGTGASKPVIQCDWDGVLDVASYSNLRFYLPTRFFGGYTPGQMELYSTSWYDLRRNEQLPHSVIDRLIGADGIHEDGPLGLGYNTQAIRVIGNFIGDYNGAATQERLADSIVRIIRSFGGPYLPVADFTTLMRLHELCNGMLDSGGIKNLLDCLHAIPFVQRRASADIVTLFRKAPRLSELTVRQLSYLLTDPVPNPLADIIVDDATLNIPRPAWMIIHTIQGASFQVRKEVVDHEGLRNLVVLGRDAAQASKIMALLLKGAFYWPAGSGPDYSNGYKIAANSQFARWILGGVETVNKPTMSRSSSMNCWEAVMFIAYLSGRLTYERLVALHQDATESALQRFPPAVGAPIGLPPVVHTTKVREYMDQLLGNAFNAGAASYWGTFYPAALFPPASLPPGVPAAPLTPPILTAMFGLPPAPAWVIAAFVPPAPALLPRVIPPGLPHSIPAAGIGVGDIVFFSSVAPPAPGTVPDPRNLGDHVAISLGTGTGQATEVMSHWCIPNANGLRVETIGSLRRAGNYIYRVPNPW